MVETLWTEAHGAGFRVTDAGEAGSGLVALTDVQNGAALALRGVVVDTVPHAQDQHSRAQVPRTAHAEAERARKLIAGHRRRGQTKSSQ